MSETKFCKDCKYFSPAKYFLSSTDYEHSKCTHKEMTTSAYRDPVSGKTIGPFYKYCSMARSHNVLCGISADYFEQRKPWWKLWMS